ncbi:putative beta-Fructufuranosidase [Pseudovirgaria hyperparasitica]|uniref:Putative beta-Fructufuranosidase n=1 Tax=Pseudovirgaria hyperparasitica TaxID=470096 RepID=A0A6A6W6D3_9PEZI|nr:putative beta-Fructufuranosidase [Pseudovirgaria hyperparasitica]KAF2757584.1 putative beta-Fructufuranosidase [Pseudovirgaria hyperparasitica]
MNDPCAPGYDPGTGLYHVSFQWNPNGSDWGDIAWASAHSHDLIHWTVKAEPSLSPDSPYDYQGVFTGCQMPTIDGSITYAYTSVSALPIHHSLSHQRGSESLSLAKSFDGGKSWTKVDANPILPSEPPELDVTGWRDPFVARWAAMSKILDRNPTSTLYGIISGGIRDVTPTTFLYAIDESNLEQWEYVGPLVNYGLNARPSMWSGDLGKNWEVTNFTSLQGADGSMINLLMMGTEGCLSTSTPDLIGPSRPARGQLWMVGSLQEPGANTYDSPVEMKYHFGGHLDHGCLYAANSFYDPKSQKQIVWAWITEDDLCDDLRHLQGWSGMLSMPRELHMQTIQHVVRGCFSDLADITSIESRLDKNGTYTISTLATQPYQPLVHALRRGPNVRKTSLTNQALSTSFLTNTRISTRQWELYVEIALATQAGRIGIRIAHSVDETRCTEIAFNPQDEMITLSRPPLPFENSARLINSAPESAPHTLFTSRSPHTHMESTETLKIRAWRDNSVLEVFVNERTAISTRLYGADETYGLSIFADEQSGSSELIRLDLWDGIGLP